MKRVPIRDIVWLFILTRLLLVMVTYFGYILLTAPKYSNDPVDVVALFSAWNHWDAENYVRIAQYGYQTKFDLAFFPLFPLLISGIAQVLGSWSYLLVGTLISNVALLGTMIVLYQLALEMGGEKVARRTLLYLCIFPTAFYFFAAYNESLFVFLLASTLLALRRQRWWLAGLCGFFAALTRNAGVLLVIPFLYELWVARQSTLATWPKRFRSILPIALIPFGTFLYCVYCWLTYSDFLGFASVQSNWGRQLAWPWHGLWQAFFELFWNQPFGSFNQAHVLLDLSATIGFIVLAFLGRYKLRTSYTIWVVVLLFYISLSPTLRQHDSLISNQRFVLEMFPAFITLGMLSLQHPRLHQTLMLVFPVLQAVLALLFVMNRWMV